MYPLDTTELYFSLMVRMPRAQELRAALEPTPLAGEDTLKRLFEVSSPLALQSALTEARALAGCDLEHGPTLSPARYVSFFYHVSVPTQSAADTSTCRELLTAGRLQPLQTLHEALQWRVIMRMRGVIRQRM